MHLMWNICIVIVDEEVYKQLEVYRDELRPQSDSEEFFLSWTGKPIDSSIVINALSSKLLRAGIEKKWVLAFIQMSISTPIFEYPTCIEDSIILILLIREDGRGGDCTKYIVNLCQHVLEINLSFSPEPFQ